MNDKLLLKKEIAILCRGIENIEIQVVVLKLKVAYLK